VRWLSGSATRRLAILQRLPRSSAHRRTRPDRKGCLPRARLLPEGDRRILILFELEELAAYEVAALLGIKAANARVRRHRGERAF